jgi:SagB-type dehydrogenase family enzyme
MKVMDSPSVVVLKDLLSARRSIRSFREHPLSLTSLETLLHAGQGHTSPDGKRTAPSAHALHPLGLTVVVRRVQGLSSGVYTYDGHTGKLSRSGDALDEGSLNSAALGDEMWLEDAPAIIAIVADREAAIRHFSDQQSDGLRGARYVDFEVGAVTQNMYLSATAAGLGGVRPQNGPQLIADIFMHRWRLCK